MNDPLDQAGFEDSILNSYDDFEPYGYASPQLMPVGATPAYPAHNPTQDRMIEADLLSQSSGGRAGRAGNSTAAGRPHSQSVPDGEG